MLPDGYGYIRRVAKIKGSSNATIIGSDYTKSDSVNTHVFSILINNTKLLGEVRDPAYQIDPLREQIMINITNLSSVCAGNPVINLTNVKLYKLDSGIYSNVPLPASNNPFIDGNTSRLPSTWPGTPATVTDNVTIKLNPQVHRLHEITEFPDFHRNEVQCNSNCTFLNNTQVVPDFDNLEGKDTYENPLIPPPLTMIITLHVSRSRNSVTR